MNKGFAFTLCFMIFMTIIALRKNISDVIEDIKCKHYFDIKAEKLQSQMIIQRSNYKYSRLCDGRILITGGNYYNRNLKSTEIFDPKTMNFSKGPDMVQPHRYHRQFTTSFCNVVIADTNFFETYNPKENKFEVWENSSIQKILNKEKSEIHGVSYLDVGNNSILISGGILYDGNKKGTPLNTAFIADYKTKKISKIDNLPFTMYNHNSGKLKEGIVLWGGRSAENSKFLVFDLKNKKFTAEDFGQSLYTMAKNKCFTIADDEVVCFSYSSNECDRCIFSIDYTPNKYRFIDKFDFKTNKREKLSVPDIVFGIEAKEDSDNEFMRQDGNIVILAKNCQIPYLLIYLPQKNKFLEYKLKEMNPENLIELNNNLILLLKNNGNNYSIRMEQKHELY